MPSRYGHKTACNMHRRHSRSGVWAKVVTVLANQYPGTQVAMADSSP